MNGFLDLRGKFLGFEILGKIVSGNNEREKEEPKCFWKPKSRKSKKKNTKIPQPSGSIDNVPDENVPTTSNDPLLGGEDRLQLTELMDLCTNLQKKVLDLKKAKTNLEKAKTAQYSEIASLKKKVKKLERRNKSRTLRLKRLRKAGSARRVESSDEASKAKMIESEKPLKNKDQIMYDQEVALNLQAQLQAELEEEERLTRQKEKEANIALIESWDNTQAMMDADYQMAQQLQAEEQEQLSIKEKSKLFVQLLEARKKHFVEMRAREKRNKPPTQAQQRKLYCSEKRAEDSTKRAGTELEQKVAKKQKIDDSKIDDDQEKAEMKKLIKVVPDEEEVAMDAIPLATKPPCIVDWKIIKEGKINQFQIIRADGSSKRYSAIIHMRKNFDREYLETLWKLMKAKHGSTRPDEGYERVLCDNCALNSYACSDSLLLTPLCCDDIHEVTPRVSALARCDILVTEPLVIKNYVSLIRTKFCWGTIFPIGLKRYSDPKEEPIEKEPFMELVECS
ncbi:hypothetical protein Tco_1123354 [Tanacetum coccineum]|uniref:Uncharacterized protein n=1 Tax=Tanacetum coccineum TaxID=301880 RepID=A0ABQ5J369_9ASTR